MTTYFPDPSQDWADIPGFGLQPGDIVDGQGQVWDIGYQLADEGSAGGGPITWRNITFTAWTPVTSFNLAFALRAQSLSYIEFENIVINPISLVGGGINDLAGIMLRGATNVGISGSSFTGISHDTGNAMGVYLGCNDQVGGIASIQISGSSFAANKTNDIRLALEISGNAAIGQDIDIVDCIGNVGTDGSFFRVFSNSNEAFFRRCQRIRLLDNILTESGNFALSIDGVDDGVVRGNQATNCGTAVSTTNNVIQISGCLNPIIEGNTVSGVKGTGGGDGHAIIIDHSAGDPTRPTTGAIVRNNTLSGADKAGSDGAGVALWQSVDAVVYGNTIRACNFGMLIRDNPTIAAEIYNNANTDCLVGGLKLFGSQTTPGVTTLENCIFEGSGPYAVVPAGGGLGTFIEDYNEYFGFAEFSAADPTGASIGANSTFGDDPDLNPATSYTQTTSPGYNAGLYISAFHGTELDQNGFTFKSPPDIGLQSNLIAPETAVIIADDEVTVEDIAQGQTLATPTLTVELITLAPIGTFQGQTLGDSAVIELGAIPVVNTAQGQALETPLLTQVQNTGVDSMAQGQALGGPQVFEDADLGAIEIIAQGQSLDTPTVDAIAQLIAESMSQVQSLGLAGMSQAQQLACEDTVQGQILGRPTISDTTLPRLTPPSRRIKVAGADVLVIGA